MTLDSWYKEYAEVDSDGENDYSKADYILGIGSPDDNESSGGRLKALIQWRADGNGGNPEQLRSWVPIVFVPLELLLNYFRGRISTLGRNKEFRIRAQKMAESNTKPIVGVPQEKKKRAKRRRSADESNSSSSEEEDEDEEEEEEEEDNEGSDLSEQDENEEEEEVEEVDEEKEEEEEEEEPFGSKELPSSPGAPSSRNSMRTLKRAVRSDESESDEAPPSPRVAAADDPVRLPKKETKPEERGSLVMKPAKSPWYKDEVVWAKITGYPWWPAKITLEDNKEMKVRKAKKPGHLLVWFFGSYEYAWLRPEDIAPFEENYQAKKNSSNINKFLNGVEEASAYLEAHKNKRSGSPTDDLVIVNPVPEVEPPRIRTPINDTDDYPARKTAALPSWSALRFIKAKLQAVPNSDKASTSDSTVVLFFLSKVKPLKGDGHIPKSITQTAALQNKAAWLSELDIRWDMRTVERLMDMLETQRDNYKRRAYNQEINPNIPNNLTDLLEDDSNESSSSSRPVSLSFDGNDNDFFAKSKEFENLEAPLRFYHPQPQMLVGGQLRKYQLDGLNWMVSVYERGMNGILADEMGLGKSVQCISMISYLMESKKIKGPFMVLAPLSILGNWEREFSRWTPSVKVLKYGGDKNAREVLRNEWFTKKRGSDQLPFNVLLTSYEMVILDMNHLRRFPWKYLVVDEAQRLKNHESKLFVTLNKQYLIPRKLLLTGTPLQNNLSELWALLNFISPQLFNDHERFLAWFKFDVGKKQEPFKRPIAQSSSTPQPPSTPVQQPPLTPSTLQTVPTEQHPGTTPGGLSSDQEMTEASAPSSLDAAKSPDSKPTPSPTTATPVTPEGPRRVTRRGAADLTAEERANEDNLSKGLDEKRKVKRKAAAPPQPTPVDSSSNTPASTPAPVFSGSSNNSSMVQKLHKILRPFMLRRLKSEVEKELPKKKEIIVYTGLTELQRRLYKWVLTNNIDMLSQGAKSKSSLQNIVMQLRKVCNHPYLFPNFRPEPYVFGDHISQNSGKLVLLDKLLPKLKAEDHRVLLFSTMTHMLDVVEDYVQWKGWRYERLDGRMRGDLRQKAVESFTQEGSEAFVFLLSTRAGGLGLNLFSADTVILLDSDWNPQVDLQAQERCHRIGQTRDVTVIRLITSKTVEERILAKAAQKLILGNLVVGKGRFNYVTGEMESASSNMQKAFSADDMTECIKCGLHEIWDDTGSMITDEDIDTILSRAKTVDNSKIQTASLAMLSGLDKPEFDLPPDEVQVLEKEASIGEKETGEDEFYAGLISKLKEEVRQQMEATAREPRKRRTVDYSKYFKVGGIPVDDIRGGVPPEVDGAQQVLDDALVAGSIDGSDRKKRRKREKSSEAEGENQMIEDEPPPPTHPLAAVALHMATRQAQRMKAGANPHLQQREPGLPALGQLSCQQESFWAHSQMYIVTYLNFIKRICDGRPNQSQLFTKLVRTVMSVFGGGKDGSGFPPEAGSGGPSLSDRQMDEIHQLMLESLPDEPKLVRGFPMFIYYLVRFHLFSVSSLQLEYPNHSPPPLQTLVKQELVDDP
eukprot:CAMPEP_0184664646 /NCGR_PEP_ID=MMETSP0308-20130426/53797_1 /TAXON_ID=38269 /ORGANISM="Gloeochaete witrockiana, Strain SAG 46.84" /LENGTH=1546 /DNA_ID=CAMNT_0027108181 /DNA_START=71 /DNA_END=4711 /DNA_ORIENTATION=+